MTEAQYMDKQPELDLGEEKAALEARLKEIEKIEVERAAAARINALAPVLAAIKQHGFTAVELGFTPFTRTSQAPASAKPAREKVEPKYCDPASTSTTWTGRGKPPAWMAAQLAAGKSKEDFLINPPAPAVPVDPLMLYNAPPDAGTPPGGSEPPAAA